MTTLERNCKAHCAFVKAMQQQVEVWISDDHSNELRDLNAALEVAYKLYLKIATAEEKNRMAKEAL